MKIKRVQNQANLVMQNRTSIRKYDPTVKISKEEITSFLQDAMTAPSSLNLQPWRFVVVEGKDAKELIKPYMMFNQQQLETSSAMIVVFGDTENFSYTDKILSANVEFGLMDEEQKKYMKGVIEGFAESYTKERLRDSVLVDCGLVTMQIMLSAKAYGYDTNPIGGFMKDELADVLGMDKKRFIPIIVLSLGKAAEEGKSTVRFSVDDITEWK